VVETLSFQHYIQQPLIYLMESTSLITLYWIHFHELRSSPFIKLKG